MSAVILPNGSMVFPLGDQTVHVDLDAAAIHVRERSTKHEVEGRVLVSFPIETASIVRLLPETGEHSHLYLEFEGGEVLDLGRLPVGNMGRHIAYALATTARCRVSTVMEVTRARAAVPAYEQETRSGSGPTKPSEPSIEDTLPRMGWNDSWREDFIKVGAAAAAQQQSAAATLVDAPAPPLDPQPTLIDVASDLLDGPQPPMPTVSAEIVEDEAPTRPPTDRDDVPSEEATIRIDLNGRTPPPKITPTEAA
jgi:hypothetical protein